MLTRAARQSSGRLLLTACTLAFAWGCGGGDIASELRMRPRPNPLPAPGAAGLVLPAQRTFSIALSSSQQSPGLGGRATADAAADRAGSARASAAVGTSGQAWGEFQLGHELRNDGDQTLMMKVAASFDYAARLSINPDEQRLPDGKVYLRLYVRDARGAIRRTDELISETTEDGDFDARGRLTVTFAAEVAPGGVYDVFLAGRVEAALPGRPAAEPLDVEAAIELSNVTMQITTSPLGAAD